MLLYFNATLMIKPCQKKNPTSTCTALPARVICNVDQSFIGQTFPLFVFFIPVLNF